ncbi:hypothetical protein L3Q82_017824 [Scortum barcoo]|uniref:Uncharacterized protein n=1 Tax=Scortum barcoo TaxID=214431 RepID=A0ACB8VMA6_9TELE|nr:hypothetical protein L3Q82_017824 [Scortum barcoo]
MVRSKELSEALRKKIVAAYESGKGFKKISKEFDISHSTIRKIVYKWRTFKTTVHHAQQDLGQLTNHRIHHEFYCVSERCLKNM